jgi:serine protease Do
MNSVTAGKLILFTAVMALCASYGIAEPTPGGTTATDPHSTAYLGVHIDDLTPQVAAVLRVNESNGAVIADVDQDGPACHAGLLENDVVVAFNGSKVMSSEQLGSLIHATPPGKVVTLTIIRAGARKDVKVTLGEWPRPMMRIHAYPTGEPLSLPGPGATGRVPSVPDVETPALIMAMSHHGLLVEPLTPQLADFFGVQPGRGVLVRSVEKGSPAEMAGLKAGDVITRVNNEQVQDVQDWRRGMYANASKISVTILRDKHEQTFVINLPPPAGSGGSSELRSQDFNDDMQAGRREMEKLGPAIAQAQQEELAAAMPDDKDLEELRREVEKSTKLSQKDMAKMRRDIEKSAKLSQKDLDRMARDIAKSARPTQKELEQMTREIQKSMPSQADMERMTREIQKSMPSQADMERMQRDVEASRQQVEDSMKSWTPQLQQQMEELRKQMEQQKLDLQQMLKQFDTRPQF